jgi:hypothetical protein
LPQSEATLEAQKQLLIKIIKIGRLLFNDGSIDTTGKIALKNVDRDIDLYYFSKENED